MSIIRFLYRKGSLKRKVLDVESDIKALMKQYFKGRYWVTHYGAYDIDAKNLVYWICVDTDSERDKLRSDKSLNGELSEILIKRNYPEKARPLVGIDFESQQTVDRESDGNWWMHFK